MILYLGTEGVLLMLIKINKQEWGERYMVRVISNIINVLISNLTSILKGLFRYISKAILAPKPRFHTKTPNTQFF